MTELSDIAWLVVVAVVFITIYTRFRKEIEDFLADLLKLVRFIRGGKK